MSIVSFKEVIDGLLSVFLFIGVLDYFSLGFEDLFFVDVEVRVV